MPRILSSSTRTNFHMIRRLRGYLQQNEIKEGHAKSRCDCPNHGIEAVIGRLRMHRTISFRLKEAQLVCKLERVTAALFVGVRNSARVETSPGGVGSAAGLNQRVRAVSPTLPQDL